MIYGLPVDSSFVSTSFSFEITQADLDVLLSDRYRRAALEVVAHTILQRSMVRGRPPVTQADFKQVLLNVLHAPQEQFEEYLATVDREHNTVVRHYIDQILARRPGRGA
ncbi:hypothetical protein G3573_03945 [Caulobacter sp. 17J65-9]|nr:hypothetical protein [Caulobacter sp. 17J65-9]